MDKPVTLAAVAGAHGVTGEVRLKLFGEGVEALKRYAAFNDGALTLKKIRSDHKGGAIARFAEVTDRTAAEGLVKAILWVDQDAAELPDESDAWYDHQLVGLRALRDGAEVGRVARVDHLPAQDLLAVATGTGEVLVPFVKAFVPAVDIAAGTVTLTPPAGLFEDLPDDDPEPPGDRAPAEHSVD